MRWDSGKTADHARRSTDDERSHRGGENPTRGRALAAPGDSVPATGEHRVGRSPCTSPGLGHGNLLSFDPEPPGASPGKHGNLTLRAAMQGHIPRDGPPVKCGARACLCLARPIRHPEKTESSGRQALSACIAVPGAPRVQLHREGFRARRHAPDRDIAVQPSLLTVCPQPCLPRSLEWATGCSVGRGRASAPERFTRWHPAGSPAGGSGTAASEGSVRMGCS